MTVEIAEIGAGLIGMYDFFVPGLQAGTYLFQLETEMAAPETKESFHHEKVTAEFTIAGPRFSLLARDEVAACFPPRGGNADYQRVLPHLVLTNRALPWERPIDPSSCAADRSPLPWMAVILLTQSEMNADNARICDISGYELISNGGPTIDIDANEAQSTVTVIEMSAQLFRATCPHIDELSLLAHVRRVSTNDKSAGLAGQSNDFAILTSNRIVQPGVNIAMLVSLEGWIPFLTNAATCPNTSRVRAVVLHSWHFTNAAGDDSFAAAIKNLDVDVFTDASAAKNTSEPQLRAMLQRGYSPIAYQPHEGQKTFAWYRGPFIPVMEASADENQLPFGCADDALVIDKGTGIVDISRSAAFQLGRLLAFSTPSFGSALRDWNHRKQLDLISSGKGATALPFIVEMAQYALSHEGPNSNDSASNNIKIVSEWLLQLRQLQFVPIHYLVPNSDFLPDESMRLFHVDNDWLDSLTDGALSMGATASSSQWHLQSSRNMIRQTLGQLLTAQRQMMRRPPAGAETRLCGLLLRSKLLQRFPGLEIECLAASSDSKLDIIRMDVIARDVLLILVIGKPREIRFKLPRESLTYSHDMVGLRPRITRVSQGVLGCRNAHHAPVAIADFLRLSPAPEGLLDVRRLHEHLEGPNDRSSARFALHWLNAPDDVAIRWEEESPEGAS